MDLYSKEGGNPVPESGRTTRQATPSATFCTLSVEETARRLHTSVENGLESAQDANYRRSVHGSNEMASEEKETMMAKFLEQFTENPLILLLIASAGVSFLMGNRDDAFSITLAILIVVTVGFVQEYRSEKSLEALTRLVPPAAHLTRGGMASQVMASTLVPGDVVHFSIGDRIPADVRLTEAVHLEIDESNLTGETTPVHKVIDTLQSSYGGLSVSERSNIAFLGTLVCSGKGSGIVVGTGHSTEFGSVFSMMSEISKPKTPLQTSMDKLGKELSMLSFGVIGLICLIGIIQGRSWLDMFQISVSLAVAAIPEGLPIIVTVTLALGVLRMADQRAIMRRLPSVETLGSVNVICSDKTGTLTKNKMTVTKLWSVDMGQVNSNARSKPWIALDHHVASTQPLEVPNSALNMVLQIGTFCNNCRRSEETGKIMGNPTDVALIEVLPKFGLDDVRPTRTRCHETPFSSKRKWMSVAIHPGDPSQAAIYIKGAFERIIPMCKTYMANDGRQQPLDASHKTTVQQVADAMAHEGARVIAFAYGAGQQSDDPKDLTFAGLVGMYDPPRAGVDESIRRLMLGGVKVIMITGDSEATATTIARQIGMPLSAGERSVMNGDTLQKLSTEELASAIDYVTVFARTSPEDKLSIVRALQARGDVVAMTGDGVNDAPALKLADIGISMGEGGTDVAKEASDMILVDDDFSTILNAIKEGKAIFNNIQSFLAFQLSTSVAALSLVALSTLLNLENPLNAMQILWINILMDGPPAQSLGVEPVDPAVMTKPPRSRNDHVLTKWLIRRVFQSGLIIVLGTLFVYITEMSDGVVTARDTTMTFTCFVFFDMFNALSCRSSTKSAFEIGFFSNKMFNIAVGLSIVGQLLVIYVPFLQAIFQTEALYFTDLLFLICITSTVWIVDEIRKYYRRRDEWLTGYSREV
uniref:Calcium-transporting ATPase n=1 Tax=Blastobotrys adeninivorans TaxID=409370 RepID=A0A060TCV0_BLAAD